MSACTKHAAEPVRGYSDCPGCEVESLRQQLAAAQAEARELRAELARVRELAAKWRAAPQNPDEPLLAMAADELEAALSQPAEQHDPLAVSDHCGECGEPEPECVCDERESLPLMARREWRESVALLDAAFDLMQEQDGWIPVSERLPPECVDVLVLHDYGQIVSNPAHRDYGKRYRCKITRRYGNEFLSDLMETGQATHWMPLPPAPQTEEPRGINVSGHTYVRRSATSYVCRRCGHDMCREGPKPCANQQPEEAP